MKRLQRRGFLAMSAAAGFLGLAGFCGSASAQDTEIRIAKQTSISYLQLYVMESEKLIEKYAKQYGLAEPKVSWMTVSGGNNINDALISGSIDVGSGGLPGLLILWSRTKGTPREVRGITVLQSAPLYLNTRNEKIKSVEDFTPADKIAIPSLKTATQAVFLQMAAAKKWGTNQYGKLDDLMVVMAPADATVALLSGAAGINSVFSVSPFQERQLKQAGIHKVVDSYDVIGGSHTSGVAWATSTFRQKNPILFKAFLAAVKEATDTINRDKRAAAKLYVDFMKSSLVLDDVVEVISSPQVKWTMSPEKTLEIAKFMKHVGTIENDPASWKDFFFPENDNQPGS